jgi:uncharacterized protein YhjY with autotransporter beta-barrel domain
MKLFLRSTLLLLAITFFETQAFSQFTFYIGPASGAFEDSSNWSDGVPSASTIAYVTPGGDYTSTSTEENGTNITVITITESSNQQAEALYVITPYNANTDTTNPGTLNLQLTAGSTLTLDSSDADGFSVLVSNQSTFNFSGGTLQADTGAIDLGLYLGTNFTGAGTFNVTSGTVNSTGDIYVGDGSDGSATGVMTQSGSSTVTVNGVLAVGYNGGTGTYTLSSGTLNISDTGSALEVGDYSGSTGTLIQSGGVLNVASDSAFVIGNVATGSYDLSGGTANISSSLTIGGSNGGDGTVNQSNGTLIVDGDTAIGAGGDGVFNLSGGSATFNSDVAIGDSGSGTMNMSGGTATFNGFAAVGYNSSGVYNLSGGTATFNGDLYVGNGSDTGTMTQSGGLAAISAGNTLVIGNAFSAYNLDGGTLQVGDTGSTNGISGSGTFNFGGGTLQATAATLTDALSGTVTNNSTISAAGSTVALTGNLSGSGSLTIVGNSATVVDLAGTGLDTSTNTETYTGGTFVDDGTLNANLNNFTSGGTLFIGSGALIDFTGTTGNTYTLASSLQGTGTLMTGDYTLELTRPLNFTGTVALGTGGTLQVFGGTLGDISGADANLTLGGDSSVATSGTLNLIGTNTYTGTTTINPGFTLLANNLASLTVDNTGSFGSNAAIGSVFNIGVAGSGSLNMPEAANEGTLLIRTDGTAADSFHVNTANLYGTVGVSGYGTNTYTIVEATSSLTTGTLNDTNTSTDDRLVAVTGSPVLFTATLSRVGNDLLLTTNQASLAQYAQNPNERAVANSLDPDLVSGGGGSTALFSSINALNAAQIPVALQQLTPESLSYMRDIAFENSTFLAQSVDNSLANIRNGFSGLDTSGLSMISPGLGDGTGRSLGSLLAYNNQGVAPNGVDYYPEEGGTPAPMTEPYETRTISDTSDPRMAPTVAPPETRSAFALPNFNEFLSGNVTLADLNQNSSGNQIPKEQYTAGNVTGGIGFHMTNNLSAGVLFNFDHTDAKTDGTGSHIRVNSYSPGLFATFFEHGFYVNGLFTFGYNTYSDNRNINFGGTSASAKSSPDGQQYVGNLDFGYDFHPDRHWVVGPTLGVEYTHLDVNSFTETGAGAADLAVSSQSADSLRARVGGHVVYQAHTGSVLFQPNLTLAYQHEFLNDPFGLTSQFDIPGTSPFTIQGTNPGRDTALIGLGLTTTLDNSLSLSLNYLAEVGGQDYFIQSVEGALKATF